MYPTKCCTKCKETKEITLFSRNKRNKDSLSYYCKACESAMRKAYIEKHGDELDLYYAMKAKTPKGKFAAWRRHIRQSYGLTVKDYEMLFTRQKGCCAGCGIHQSKLKHKLGINKTKQGRIRGLACKSCALGLNGFKDSCILLERAWHFLKNN